jgi:cytidyltransferase-like protein
LPPAALGVDRRGATPVGKAELVVDLIPDRGDRRRVAAGDPRAADERGQSIAWTNGCFDLLHAGHVQALTEARAQGLDLLVVGLNDDESVRSLKGPGDRLRSLADRTEVLSAGRRRLCGPVQRPRAPTPRSAPSSPASWPRARSCRGRAGPARGLVRSRRPRPFHDDASRPLDHATREGRGPGIGGRQCGLDPGPLTPAPELHRWEDDGGRPM